MRRCSLTRAVGVLALVAMGACSKRTASGTDAADGPGMGDAPADLPAPTDVPMSNDAPVSIDNRLDAPPMDLPPPQCPMFVPVDGASCSTPGIYCSYPSCGERQFLCFAFEVGAPAKWICLTNCSCDGGGD